MSQRYGMIPLVLVTVSGLIGGCGKKDTPSPVGAIPAANPTPAVQVNMSGALPVVLGPDTIQGEIDKAGAGIKLVSLDLGTLGLPLTLDAPQGAKAQRGLALQRQAVDVEIHAGDHFALRIRKGKKPFDEKRKQLGGKVLVDTRDLILTSTMLLLDERCEFARHVSVGLQDYTIENIAPLVPRQINHSQADCLLMLKCIGTLKARTTPPVAAARPHETSARRR